MGGERELDNKTEDNKKHAPLSQICVSHALHGKVAAKKEEHTSQCLSVPFAVKSKESNVAAGKCHTCDQGCNRQVHLGIILKLQIQEDS